MLTPKDGTPTAPRLLLEDAASYAVEFLEGLPERTVAPRAAAGELREELGGPLAPYSP